MTMSRMKLLSFLLILSIGVFYLSTIRDGYGWGDDFGLYILHAINIVEGRAYLDTIYIYNPNIPNSPIGYPPVFPLLLAPVYGAFGLDLHAMKVEEVFFFVAFMFALYATIVGVLGPGRTIILLLLVGLNPLYWGFKDHILSDFPFLFFVYLTLWAASRNYGENDEPGWQAGALAGICAFLAYCTRTAGITLILAVIAYDVIKRRRLGAFSIAAMLSFVVPSALRALVAGGEASYFNHVTNLSPMALHSVAVLYRNKVMTFFLSGGHLPVMMLVLAAYAFFVLMGLLKKYRLRSLLLHDIFFAFYLAFIGAYTYSIWPLYTDPRLLFPLFPLLVVYAIEGCGIVRNRFWRQTISLAALVALTLFSYGLEYKKLGFGPIVEGIEKKESIELFDYVRSNTERKDAIIFIKPRALTLMTGRPSAVYHTPDDRTKLFEYMKSINAKYLINSPLDGEYLRSFIQQFNDKLCPVFKNSDFVMFRIEY